MTNPGSRLPGRAPRRRCPPAARARRLGLTADEAIRALWLRRVQTRPADFLRARFAFQLQSGDNP